MTIHCQEVIMTEIMIMQVIDSSHCNNNNNDDDDDNDFDSLTCQYASFDNSSEITELSLKRNKKIIWNCLSFFQEKVEKKYFVVVRGGGEWGMG